MKKTNVIFIALTFLAIGFLASCKKKEEEKPTTPTSKPNDKQGSSEADEAVDNVNDFINNRIGTGSSRMRTSGTSAYSLPCGVVSVDSTTDGNGKKTYFMRYGNQTSCGLSQYKKKSGDVSFSLNSTGGFNDINAVYTITFINYKVENTINAQTVTINGSLVIKNTTGGYIWEVVTGAKTSVSHSIRGTFTVTYSDGVSRSRSYFQTRTYASTSGWSGLSLTAAGDTTIGSASVSEIGKTYENNLDYQTEISVPLVWSNCGTTWAGPYVLKQGKGKFNVSVPLISPTYIEVEAGYKWDYASGATTATLKNDCTSNAYKVNTVIGTSTTTTYQLY